ncbi:hypothetical protein [Vibrio furnissii]|uniref:hypothetical protein n=1 Tax=Vibrio furnissii TaxID=29494 RepID=UPI001E3E257C|nr:hypothetical protein [Vibrio furnissii]UHJ59471.1 hypothetical protein LUM42_11455 [Vibrio furnissii]
MDTEKTCELFVFTGKAKDSTFNDVRDLDIHPYPQARKKCHMLWDQFKPLADTKFITQFRNHFAGGYWEMLLAHKLQEQGFDLTSKDDGPDLCTAINGQTAYFEAICPTGGTGDNEVLGLPASDYIQALIKEPAALRLTSAFVNKSRIFRNYMTQGIVAQNDILVIAINGECIPDIHIENPECPEIVKVTYAIGSYEFRKNSQTEVLTGSYKRRDYIENPKGSRIPTNLFVDPANENISAVLYTHENAFSFGNYYLVHNPNATNPLPMGCIKGVREFSLLLTDGGETLQWEMT